MARFSHAAQDRRVLTTTVWEEGLGPDMSTIQVYPADPYRSHPNPSPTRRPRPDAYAYHDALMDKEGGLTKAEREMIVVATSVANECQYCVIAHGAILRIRAKNPLIADQVASNYRKADLTARQRAMLDFAMKVSQQA